MIYKGCKERIYRKILAKCRKNYQFVWWYQKKTLLLQAYNIKQLKQERI